MHWKQIAETRQFTIKSTIKEKIYSPRRKNCCAWDSACGWFDDAEFSLGTTGHILLYLRNIRTLALNINIYLTFAAGSFLRLLLE